MKVIAFDADDTLSVNEPYFIEAEKHFCQMMEDFLPIHSTSQELFKTEMDNLDTYGYGVKGFMLSMIETATRISKGTIGLDGIERILAIGKELIHKPIEILPGVEEVLGALSQKYRLVVATKGDLLDQERKLTKSGLEKHFHHIEIMSNKKEHDYLKLIQHLDIQTNEFLMVGNSLKSDILPVLAIGGHGVHVPFHTTWAHEQVSHQIIHENFREVKEMFEVLDFL
ncbi:HAD family hydrolase [Aquirufa salirivi]|uniref:HAD family hydrolase n=1 Tax=Aquirufa salirivi TaxID=3104729 RepID=A0ABW8RUJ5_9BACT